MFGPIKVSSIRVLFALLCITIISCNTEEQKQIENEAHIAEVAPYSLENITISSLDNFDSVQFDLVESAAITEVKKFVKNLQAIADTSNSTGLREEMYAAALGQFEDGAKIASEDLEMPVHLFLQYVLVSDTSFGEYAVSDILIDSGIAANKKQGVLTCLIYGLEGGSAKCTVNYTLKKKRRLDAENKQVVWTVFLGDIAPWKTSRD